VDLKAFTEDFYMKLTGSHLQPVLDTLVYLKRETSVWFEITTLLIPGHNDSDEEITAMCRWIMAELGPDVPLHFSAFHPDHKMPDIAATPPATLVRARHVARALGLQHVYTGNVRNREGDTTYCPHCQAELIERDWYRIVQYRLTATGCCPECNAALSGRFSTKAEHFGRQRIPITIGA
jgi:pyruvate formate lyase activating enzyme